LWRSFLRRGVTTWGTYALSAHCFWRVWRAHWLGHCQDRRLPRRHRIRVFEAVLPGLAVRSLIWPPAGDPNLARRAFSKPHKCFLRRLFP
jgi:hypothetical protein